MFMQGTGTYLFYFRHLLKYDKRNVPLSYLKIPKALTIRKKLLRFYRFSVKSYRMIDLAPLPIYLSRLAAHLIAIIPFVI